MEEINKDDYLIYASFNYSNYNSFKNIIETIGLFNNEFLIKFSNQNIILTNLQQTENNSCSFTYCIPSYNLTYYYCNGENLNIGINSLNLIKVLNSNIHSSIEQKNIILSVSKAKSNQLIITIKNSQQQPDCNILDISYIINCLDLNKIEKVNYQFNDYNFTYRIILNKILFYNCINNINKYNINKCKFINIELNPNKFIISSKQNNHNIIHEFSGFNVNELINEHTINVEVDMDFLKNNQQFNFKSNYNINYIKTLLERHENINFIDIRLGNNLLRLGDNLPMGLSFDIDNSFGKCLFLIYPNK